MTDNTPDDLVVVERRGGGVVLVRINRPEARNALNMGLRRQLAEIFRGFVDDADLRCVVLTGNDKTFAAGADIRDMAEASSIDMYLRHNERLWAAIAQGVVRKMKETPVDDFFARGGKIREDERMVHDMYLVQVKAPEESKYPWDYYKVVRTVSGDRAFRPLSESECPLVKK